MYQLVIGNKNYSSWSLRPWLVMRAAKIDFEEINIALYSEAGKQQLLKYSQAGKVPLLLVDEMTIWDSLAIVEFLAERHPEKSLWPLASDSRAIARSVVSEMHSSFHGLRNSLPMNCKLQIKYDKINTDTQKDIDRIGQIWRYCRRQFGQQGEFLFGNFSIVDAFYAPVVLRFHSYGIELGDVERSYMLKMLEVPELEEWVVAAKREDTVVDAYEIT